MANRQIGQAIIDLDGWPGAPGVNVLHWRMPDDADLEQSNWESLAAALDTMYANITQLFAAGVTAQVRPQCSVLDEGEGNLVNVLTTTTPGDPHTGIGDAYIDRTSQMVLALHTGYIWHSREIQGRIFVGPTAQGVFGPNGLVGDDVRGDLEDAFGVVMDGTDYYLGVWSRPQPGLLIPRVGRLADITSWHANTRPGALRRRRD